MQKKHLILQIFFGLLLFNSPVYAQTATTITNTTATKSPAKIATVTAEEYVHLGNISGRQENYKEAILDYTKAIEKKPDLANAYYNRGYVYIETKKYKLAIADLDKAIEIDPQYTAAYHVRGIAYFSKKKYARSVVDYSKAIELDPTNIHYYISRMSAFCKLGNNDKAWKDVIKIQELGGTVNPAIINILKGKKYREKI